MLDWNKETVDCGYGTTAITAITASDFSIKPADHDDHVALCNADGEGKAWYDMVNEHTRAACGLDSECGLRAGQRRGWAWYYDGEIQGIETNLDTAKFEAVRMFVVQALETARCDIGDYSAKLEQTVESSLDEVLRFVGMVAAGSRTGFGVDRTGN